MKNVLSLGILTLLSLTLVSCTKKQSPLMSCDPLKSLSKPEDIFTLQILHLSDQEGNINALKDAPRASSVINTFKPTFKNTVIISSGDNYLSSSFSKTSTDEKMKDLIGSTGFAKADILITNALGVQVSAIGNHEFDKGPKPLYEAIKKDGQYVGAAFPYLSSNIDFSKEDLNKLVTENDQEASHISNKIANTTIITVNGRKVGFIGAVTQELNNIANTGSLEILPKDKGVNYNNLAKIIQSHADRLTKKGVDIIIVLSHMQEIEIEEHLAGLLKDVDIIAAGGSDSILIDDNDRLREGHKAYGKYPLWKKDASGKDVAVVNTDGQYLYIGRLIAHFNKQGELVKDLHNDCESGAFATDAKGVKELGSTPADHRIKDIVKKIDSIIGPKSRNIIAKTNVFLNAERENVRRSFTNLGSLTAKSLKWYAKEYYGIEVVAALKNSGGIRTSIGRIEVPPGLTVAKRLPPIGNNISELDIEKALSFDNGISILNLTGKNLIDQLEKSLSAQYLKDHEGIPVKPLKLVKNGQFPQLTGMDIKYDIQKEAGKRIINLKLSNGDDLVKNGKLIDENLAKIYKIATLTFLADGNESIFGALPKEQLKRIDLESIKQIKRPKFSFGKAGHEQAALSEYLNAMYSKEAYQD